ncbi:hypothetical protein CF327_g6900 [Tilletia walkeri]|nr:hypothetical protein CF327_g6900 [Tilletia walkeri]
MLRRRLIAPPGLARHPISAPFFGQRPPCSPAFKTLPSLLRNTSLFHRHQTDLTPGLSTSNDIPRGLDSFSGRIFNTALALVSLQCQSTSAGSRGQVPSPGVYARNMELRDLGTLKLKSGNSIAWPGRIDHLSRSTIEHQKWLVRRLLKIWTANLAVEDWTQRFRSIQLQLKDVLSLQNLLT